MPVVVLLFIFWYCHKRGKEVRLEKERLLTESEIAALDEDAPTTASDAPPTTTVPSGASSAQVEAGMREANLNVQQQRGRTGHYAEDGSLAKDQKSHEHKRKAGERSRSGTGHELQS